ncbi:Acg family FMN-binding oxidoreductase [Nocardia asteroides]|uniref:Acg family FMN-binding oxidoreductase n=1 Tax=Nocardia asteroides TaxID=1824 RepID=UPI0036643E88
MRAVGPGHEVCRDAIELAVRAPSVHNSQPWRWRVGTDRVDLFADVGRKLTATDPLARALMVSCGAALHHLDVAFAMLGWRTEIERLPDPGDPEHLATIGFTPRPASAADIRLAAAILLRQSDRRRYPGPPVGAGDLRAVSRCAAHHGAAARHVPDRLLPGLAAPMRRAAARHAVDTDYLSELAEWSGCHGTTTGVPARNVPPARPSDDMPVRAFAGTELAEYTESPDSAHWLVVCTTRDDRLAQLRAGEATSAMLLEATARGLATSLQSEPLGMLDLRAEIRDTVLQQCAFPHVMLRVGAMPYAAAPLESTPRRPVAEVLDVA